MEVVIAALTGLGLSVSSGLNAYVPLLAAGLASRLLGVFDLPPAWQWLGDPWVLLVLGLLLAVEVVADKVPVVDTVNDILQTVVRPTSGGIAVGAAGWGGRVEVQDPRAFVSEGAWLPLVVGAAIALAVHLAKAGLRATANATTAGLAAPVLSTAEDAVAVTLSLAAILVPALVAVLVIVLAWWWVRARRRAAGRTAPARGAESSG